MPAQFIAIEGLDGAGKSTQIELLIQYFKSKGVETKFVHFPRHHDGVFGELISKFLRGEFGDVQQVHPQLVALLFAEDRRDFSSTILNWMKEGYFVLVDRYVLSNIAFQCAKTNGEEQKEELRKWIYSFEYEYNQIPKPDLSIYLDVPFSFTQKSLDKRRANENRSYLNGQEDIHENDMDLQRAVKNEYDKLVNTESDITRIQCADESNQMRSIAEIHEEIVRRIGGSEK